MNVQVVCELWFFPPLLNLFGEHVKLMNKYKLPAQRPAKRTKAGKKWEEINLYNNRRTNDAREKRK